MSGLILLLLRILIAATLYAFVGWAFWTIWRDLKRQSQLMTTQKPSLLTLLATIDGEERPSHFTTPMVTIGRDPGCDYVLGDTTVSAQHARLSYRQNQWWLEDLRSTNGTLLNQEPVTDPIVITNGDQLLCGQVLVDIKIGE
jgi:pSer/pThr/pTyr-binding forkhead associated (FHA) protein